MARMETLPDHMQGMKHLYSAGDSDVSDSSYLASRQSSINTEPLTLDAEEIDSAKGEAKHVLESVDPEEALNIFTKDLRLENGEATTEEEMVKKKAARSGSNLKEKDGSFIPEEDEMAKKTVHNHFEKLLQKATAVVEANEKLSQATAKSPGTPGTPKEESPAGG